MAEELPFKQYISSMFKELHELLYGLESEIIARQEMIKEEIMKELLNKIDAVYEQSTSGLLDKTSFLSLLGSAPDEKRKLHSFDKSNVPTTKSDLNSEINCVDSNYFGTNQNIKINGVTSKSNKYKEFRVQVNQSYQVESLSKVISTVEKLKSISQTISTENFRWKLEEKELQVLDGLRKFNVKSTQSTKSLPDIHINRDINWKSIENSSEASTHNGYFESDDTQTNDMPVSMIVPIDPNEFFETNKIGIHDHGHQLHSNHVLQKDRASNRSLKVKENECPLCNQKFTQTNSLKRHIRSHTGEKPFPCDFCEKRFIDKERLKVHIRIHTGEKPFPCSHCGRRFSQKSTVKRHMSVHTGEKPFSCNNCGKGFGTRDNLKVHEKNQRCDVKLKGVTVGVSHYL